GREENPALGEANDLRGICFPGRPSRRWAAGRPPTMGWMPARPDPAQLAAWRRLLEAHATVTELLEHELVAERGLPLSRYDVLLNLAEAPGGRLRMQELSASVLLSKSGMSRLVGRMDEAGLARRGRPRGVVRGPHRPGPQHPAPGRPGAPARHPRALRPAPGPGRDRGPDRRPVQGRGRGPGLGRGRPRPGP